MTRIPHSLPMILLGVTLLYAQLAFLTFTKVDTQSSTGASPVRDNKRALRPYQQRPQQERQRQEPRCALLFFGLPRSYKDLVLPSVVKNVLIPNEKYKCDVYAHSVIRLQEEAGRSGAGGRIDPSSIFELKQRVVDIAKATVNKSTKTSRLPHVTIATDTEDDFWRMHNATIQKYRTTKDAKGRLLYSPWRKRSYIFPTTMDNIVKQWHSIQSAWELMETESAKLGMSYDRVAMLRSDVFYATPIDIYRVGNRTIFDKTNNATVIPGFALYPVNDRMVYGPYSVVKIWATERFQRLDNHVRRVQPGVGMHPETFLRDVILPAMEEIGTRIVTDNDICFFRVRSDRTVRTIDCLGKESNWTGKQKRVNNLALIKDITGQACHRPIKGSNISGVICPATQDNVG